jgi:hypothetical protein
MLPALLAESEEYFPTLLMGCAMGALLLPPCRSCGGSATAVCACAATAASVTVREPQGQSMCAGDRALDSWESELQFAATWSRRVRKAFLLLQGGELGLEWSLAPWQGLELVCKGNP